MPIYLGKYNSLMKREEGFIHLKQGKVWYEIVGDKERTPLITVHGGPGVPHDYLLPLEDLTDERPIIFYDQLGCGNSQRTKNKSTWTVEYFVLELQKVIKDLKLKEYHMLGQSWGAGLAVAFALKKPKGLKSLILADPYLSTPFWEKDAERLIKELPKGVQKALKEGKNETKEYKEAAKQFYSKYVWGMKERPVASLKAQHKISLEIYNYMWGPEEFKAIGSLENFDMLPRLHEIEVQVLLICGRFDEATPESCEYFKNQFPNAKLKVFENSAHMPHWSERKEYINTVRKFLNSI